MPFDYYKEPKVETPCPLCGEENTIEAARDRNGIAIGGSVCACGFRYINPRMTADGYARFYQHAYREHVAQSENRDYDPTRLRLEQRSFGASLALSLLTYGVPMTGRVLDVGGGSGAVLDGMGVKGTVVDPSLDDIAVALSNGHEAREGTAETEIMWREPFDLVMCLKTLDHCLDPIGALKNLKLAMAKDAWCLVTAVDVVFRTAQHPTQKWKIDHPCYFTGSTFKAAIIKAGLVPTRMARFANMSQMMALCR